MSKTPFVLLVLGCLLLPLSSVQAKPYDGKHLLDGCRIVAGDDVTSVKPEEKENASYFCVGVLMGATSMHHVQSNFHRVPTGLCLPEEVDMDGYIKALISYLENNRYLLSEPAGVVAAKALYDKYPCK